jgi:anti-anti-sigma factor
MRLADVQFESSGDVVIARVIGDIDMSNAEKIAKALVERTPNHVAGVVADLREVGYLDSAGIHLVYRVRESLRTRGQTLGLVVLPESIVADALRLAGVSENLGVSETLEQALTAVRH